ncbi:MAG: DNA-processing protein DprA [Acidobacteriota bacterium]
MAKWLRDAASITAAERRRASRLQARILTRVDEEYPSDLLDLELPPPVLFCRGHLPPKPAIAIVGSRKARATNLEVARMFGHGLAAAGITVVSGFARGIDQAAHRGALSARGGTTVAILGCGLDVDYPGGARPLAARIESSGALVSEFPLRTRPFKSNFPIRNRLIAALSLGTLVVQATLRSGSLITARLALDLGRDVYAVPGSIVDPSAAGTNGLIRDGALLAQETRDILEALPVLVRAALVSAPPQHSPPHRISTTHPTHCSHRYPRAASYHWRSSRRRLGWGRKAYSTNCSISRCRARFDDAPVRRFCALYELREQTAPGCGRSNWSAKVAHRPKSYWQALTSVA